jgi:hypothetical protein
LEKPRVPVSKVWKSPAARRAAAGRAEHFALFQ